MRASDVRPVADVGPAAWIADALAAHERQWEVGAVVPAGYASYVEVVLDDADTYWTVRDLLARHTDPSAACWFALWEGWPVPVWWQDAPTFHAHVGGTLLFAGRFEDAEVVAIEFACAGLEQGTSVVHSPPPTAEQRRLGARNNRAWRTHVPPSLWWPDDRAWVLARHVGSDCLLFAGADEVAADLLAAPGLAVRRTGLGEPLRIEE